MYDIDSLAKRLQPHYSRFDVANRLLFTGHSHQAWPDVAFEGLQASFTDAARYVDNKWDAAAEQTEKLRGYLRNFYDDPDGLYSLGENTHLLLVTWLSSFDLKQKPKIVTTNGEFHSMFRQLQRLAEEGLQIEMADAKSDTLAEDIDRLADQSTAAIMLSRVFFQSSLINQHISEIAERARAKNIPLLIDDYHGTNVAPISLREHNLEDTYWLIGGYKYLQWGEGNCFLRFPKECSLRPAVTGWFASFSTLDHPRSGNTIRYDEGDGRFVSGTYDPASQYRAARVVDFFNEQKLTPDVLHRHYQAQIGLLRSLFEEQKFNPSHIKLRHNLPLQENGGFLALQSPKAREIRAWLLDHGVYTDARDNILRIGPAPYITTSQIEQAIEKLARCVKEIF